MIRIKLKLKLNIYKKLGISYEEFMKIFNSKPKSYKDYPNDEKKLEFIYKIYRNYFNK